MRLASFLRPRTRPTLTPQSYAWAAATPLDILGDAVAGDAALRSVEIVTQPLYGTATVIRDNTTGLGNVLFEPPPDAGQTWSTTFSARVRDVAGLASGVVTITVGVAPEDPEPTFANGYVWRQRINVASRTGTNEALADFLLLVDVTDDDLRTTGNGGVVTDAAGDDIRFELSDGSKLDHYNDTYDGVDGRVVSVVRLPTWETGTGYPLYMYAGNSAQTTPEGNSSDVFASYSYAWHARTGADLKGGVGAVTMTGVGQGELAGDAGDYVGSASYGRRLYADGGLAGLAGMTAMTVQAIVKSDLIGGRRGIIAQGPLDGTDATSSLFLAYVQATWAGATNAIQFQWRNSGGSNYTVSQSGKHTTSAQVVHASWASGSVPNLYLNGVLQTASASGFAAGAGITPNGDLYLGVAPGPLNPASTGWDGLISHVRIRANALSAMHIAAEAANLASPTAFYSRGAAERPDDPAQPPIAVVDTITTAFETSVLIDVLANDSDPLGDALTLVSVGSASPNGTTAIESGKVRYTPASDFSGQATFAYTIRNESLLEASAQVTVTVQPEVVSGGASWLGTESALGWTSGAWYWYAELDALRINPANSLKRKMDMTTTFFWRGGWANRGASTVSNENNSTANNWMVANGTPAINIAIQPFCSDQQFGGGSPSNTLANWPSSPSGITVNHWISPNRPVGFISGDVLSHAQKVSLIMEVWQRAANGWFDHIWEPELQYFKTNYIVARGLTGKRLIWRPFWESNGGYPNIWGATGAIYQSSVLGMRTQAHATIIKAALKHYNDILKSVFPGCFVHWCPLPDNLHNGYVGLGTTTPNLTGMDAVNPLDWDIIGPDYYDIGSSLGVSSGTYTDRWNVLANRGSAAVPVGILKWVDWVRNVARPINPNARFGIGEWGVYKTGDVHSGGGDDPVFVQKMFEMFQANADIMAYESYFNDNSGGTLLGPPGSLTTFPNASAMYKTKYGTRT